MDRTAEAAASLFGCRPDEVFIASTGVIGEPLPEHLIAGGSAGAAREPRRGRLAGGRGRHHDHRHLPQGSRRAPARIGEATVTLNGIAKGSGHDRAGHGHDAGLRLHRRGDPRHGAADAAEGRRRTLVQRHHGRQRHLDHRHAAAVRHRPGGASARCRRSATRTCADFRRALYEICYRPRPSGRPRWRRGDRSSSRSGSRAPARRGRRKRIGLSIANSPLVKTAIAGEDANWGRIVMAVGKAGEPADRDRLVIGVGGVWMTRDGRRVAGLRRGVPSSRIWKGREIDIEVDVGIGRGRGHRLDLRPHARLHRHQRLVPELTGDA